MSRPARSAHETVRRARSRAGAALPPPLYRALRRRRMGSAIAHFRPRIVRHRYDGVELAVLIADPLAERWYDVDWPALPELALLREHGLRPGARVFDLGAHQGVVALLLDHHAGEGGSVVCVEPVAHNLRIAERNRELNGAAGLSFLRAAASDGSVPEVDVMDDFNGRVVLDGHRATTPVPAVSVDALAASCGAPDVVVIDVEGHEQRVLAGASETLARGEASFLVEVHAGCGLEEGGGTVAQVLDAFGPRYERLVAPVAGDRTHRFVALDDPAAAGVIRRHFFLVAVPVAPPA